MGLTRESLETVFKDLGLTVESDGNQYLHTTEGRHAPLISTILTVDEDLSGGTVITALSERVASQKRAAVYELLNMVHGQNLWNVRFHLDETGRVFSIGKILLWGLPLNSVQFGDVFFTLLVTTDRLYPCIIAINEEGMSAEDAFERFFLKPAPKEDADPSSQTPDQ